MKKLLRRLILCFVSSMFAPESNVEELLLELDQGQLGVQLHVINGIPSLRVSRYRDKMSDHEREFLIYILDQRRLEAHPNYDYRADPWRGIVARTNREERRLGNINLGDVVETLPEPDPDSDIPVDTKTKQEIEANRILNNRSRMNELLSCLASPHVTLEVHMSHILSTGVRKNEHLFTKSAMSRSGLVQILLDLIKPTRRFSRFFGLLDASLKTNPYPELEIDCYPVVRDGKDVFLFRIENYLDHPDPSREQECVRIEIVFSLLSDMTEQEAKEMKSDLKNPLCFITSPKVLHHHRAIFHVLLSNPEETILHQDNLEFSSGLNGESLYSLICRMNPVST